jgi:hypothetical protein
MPVNYPLLTVVVGLYYFWHVFIIFGWKWLSQNLQLRCFMDVAIIPLRYSCFWMFSVVLCVYVVIFCRMTSC